MLAEPIDADVDAWEAWDPPAVTERLRGVETPWRIVGGWALDLWRGEQTREHEDLEIAVPEAGFDEVRERLRDLEFFVPCGESRLVALEGAGDRYFGSHQTWGRDPVTKKWRIDVMRDPHDGDVWICRRDRRIRRTYGEIIAFTPHGIPYEIPELTLLFKAKHMRDKDEVDFVATAPLLDSNARAWLRGTLTELYGPDQPWVSKLG
jgi:aminoglycoside-2''-adenylyltransferase